MGVGTSGGGEPKGGFPSGGGVDAARAAELVRGGRVVVLDVREPEEWRAGHMPGALHIPLGDLGARLAELPGDGTPIVAVCRSGARSGYATEALHHAGLRVANLEGGMQAWHARGLPMEPPDGHVA